MLVRSAVVTGHKGEKGQEKEAFGSSQGSLHLVDKFAVPLPLTLGIHLGLCLADHGQAVHAEHIVLKECLLSLEAHRQIEDVLYGGRLVDLTP